MANARAAKGDELMNGKACAICGHGNEADANFCAKCGQALGGETVSVASAQSELSGSGRDWLGLVEEPDSAVSSPSFPPLSSGGRSDPPGGELVGLEREVRAFSEDPAPPVPMPDVVDDSEPRRSLWPLAIAGAMLAGLAGVYFGSSLFAGPQMAEVSVGDDGTKTGQSPDARPAWQASYADTFLSPGTVIMTVSADARMREFPSTDDTTVVRELREGEMVSGRWVRGVDPTSRWLKLSDGGYIWDGNLAVAGGPGSPIAIPFSSRDTSFGPEIGRYLAEAAAIRDRRAARADALPPKEREAWWDAHETDATYVRVPNRRFHGLTITAVGQYYESSGIIFREPQRRVIEILRAAGIVITDDGEVSLIGDVVESCSIIALGADDQAREYGASALDCGV